MRAHVLATILDVSISDVLNLADRLDRHEVMTFNEFTILNEETAHAVVDHFEREAKRDRFAEARKAIENFTKASKE